MTSLRIQLFVFIAPVLGFICVGGLACSEWSKILQLREMARVFHGQSKIVVFNDLGVHESDGRDYATYEFDADGGKALFLTRRPIQLPIDGRVRIGRSPFPNPQHSHYQPSWEQPRGRSEIAVPLHGEDSVDTLYRGMRGQPMDKDMKKSMLVTAGAFVIGLGGLLIQQRFRDELHTAADGRAHRARKPRLKEQEKTNIRVLGLVHLILGPTILLAACFFWAMLFREAVLEIILWMAAVYVSVVGVMLLASGAGILMRRRWVLPYMRLIGLLLMILFPLGTVLGVWTLAMHSRLSARVR